MNTSLVDAFYFKIDYPKILLSVNNLPVSKNWQLCTEIILQKQMPVFESAIDSYPPSLCMEFLDSPLVWERVVSLIYTENKYIQLNNSC